MILEIRDVGRKTPGDGRLEITEATFRRLSMEQELRATVDDVKASALLERMPCTCRAGEGKAHAHWFVRSDAFRHLVPGETCVLELTSPGRLTAARPHPLAP
ncbi:MAG: hypothetical protein H7066_18905 [Cytophagaceae bacterium]|nr:hypothetical protein [Gemmatimonadaceae bacterium]